MKQLDTFIELIENQFEYGGKKYGLNDKRESTDELFDAHGKNWLIGTIDKYTYRFKNLARERDLLKIATYMYILWLKRGFFVVQDKNRGMSDPVDTNITIKTKEFPKFVDEVTKFYEKYKSEFTLIDDKLAMISLILKNWSSKEWTAISEFHISQVFCLCFIVWYSNYSKVEKHDTDTYNSADKGSENYKNEKKEK